MKTIALVNYKGGVGKTTSAINIGAGMALKGKKVLLIDADPQANLTDGFGIFNPEKTLYNSMSSGEPLPIMEIKKNLYIVPSSFDLIGIEPELQSKIAVAKEKILVKLIEKHVQGFDVCIIDCPPSMGLITVNALVAADEVYVPITAEFFAFRGIDNIVDIIGRIKENFNEKLFIKGIFFTKFNEKLVLSKGINKEVENSVGKVLMSSAIRINVTLAEAQTSGKDIFEYDSECNGSEDYRKLVNEMLKN